VQKHDLLCKFFLQAVIENTRANEILKQAPFLIPFTSRAKIFTVRISLSSDVIQIGVIFILQNFSG